MTSPDRASPQSGFILPAVLAVLAMIGLVTLGAVLALRSSTDAVESARRMADLERAALTAEARLSFIAATQPLSSAGFRVNGVRITSAQSNGTEAFPFELDDPAYVGTPLRLDGRPYALPTGDSVRVPLVVSMQDEAGLINVNGAGAPTIGRLLVLAGASPGEARRLAAQITDFTDIDNDVQFEGAEAADYRRRGEPPPSNKITQRPQDVFRVPEGLPASIDRALLADVLAAGVPRTINVNTAPPLALQAAFDLTPADAAAAVRARNLQPFVSIDGFTSVVRTNVDTSPEAVYTFPSQSFRVRVRSADGGPVLERLLEVTPRNSLRPVWVLDRRQLPYRPASSQEPEDLAPTALPTPTSLASAR